MKSRTWEAKAACSPLVRDDDLDWFSTNAEEKYKARAICQSECTVRKECLQSALDHTTTYGIWGGVDDYELRRTLSVDAVGEPVQRDRPPRCPFCTSKKLEISRSRTVRGYATKCLECELTWNMARFPAKLKAQQAAAAGQTLKATGT